MTQLFVLLINWLNYWLLKWRVDKIISWFNDQFNKITTRIKWQFDEMNCWQNDKLVKWQWTELTIWQNDHLLKGPASEMTEHHNNDIAIFISDFGLYHLKEEPKLSSVQWTVGLWCIWWEDQVSMLFKKISCVADDKAKKARVLVPGNHFPV